jgi:hypothetical protein
MIQNTYIPLNSKSKIRIDASNTIQYTLLLNYNTPTLNDDESKFVNSLMDKCHECCRGLFSNTKQTSYYYFFGHSREVLPFPLYSLNYEPVPDDLNSPYHDFGFHTMIMQHCIISSYHAILTELLNNQTLSSYSVENKIKNRGFFDLYKKGAISISENDVTFHELNKGFNSQKSSKAAAFDGITRTHINAIPNIMKFFMMDSTQETLSYKLQFASLAYHINKIRATDFNVLRSDSSNSTLDILRKIETLTRKMEPSIDHYSEIYEKDFCQTGRNPVDGLYHYYLTERLFNFNLFYNLLKNIKRIEKDTTYRLCQSNILSTLLCCKKLPNVFSRQYFLKYAFDHIIAEPDSYNDFWHTQDLFRNNTLFSSTRKHHACFQFTQWLEQYELFINYMTEYVIPVYEWCFITMLFHAIEEKYPDSGHNSHSQTALQLLTEYMKNNYQKILHPISCSDDLDNLDIATKHKNIEELENIFRQNATLFMNTLFYSENTLELNLKLLNPNYFKISNPNSPISDNNEGRIRKFYIDLIRYTYLQP